MIINNSIYKHNYSDWGNKLKGKAIRLVSDEVIWLYDDKKEVFNLGEDMEVVENVDKFYGSS